ncbi:sulfate ABC transporter permease subunit [Komagataeibacter rhaeticus]|uniref:sulfate ABC transporter permease n=1 Tax=Komagataeibacter rhaeticus TaxID=215221 RepID=UPI0004D99C43|nr:sulfate ABC transporter permease subunit [Komagataeibacter rhaeticus]KDU96724.1 sulfate transport system permease CysW [Komagataeibacter rhaeticus AF1]PYD54350.1 sulfate ABC transporter permease subunit [Komagataeibacter rhaeticus]GBQ14605.1 sulfate transporter permease CysW [Komagataeibacter rhaeticus DSM 16663]
MSRLLFALVVYLLVAVMVVLPPVMVFAAALSHGLRVAMATLAEPDALSAIRLTMIVTGISVAINTVFGTMAAWTLAHFRFPGRNLLVVLIELPLSVSPVVGGLVWLLVFGTQGWWGAALERWGHPVLFAPPGIVLATVFVTFPYVTRTLMPMLAHNGREAEEAAVMLGANLWQVLWHVTLPGARLALLSGVLLTTARAMGEFGAVSVVSGHIPGLTETMPLHIETLYNGYQTVAAFTMAALLALMAMGVVMARNLTERRHGRTENTA